MKLDLDTAEQVQRMLVTPLVDAVKGEITNVMDRVEVIESDVKNLKSNQTKAMVGWGVFATIGAAGLGWLKTKLFG